MKSSTYRALWTADIHFYNRLPYAKTDPETLVSDRIMDLVYVMKSMKQYADKHGIEDIWILGDYFDSSLLDAVTNKIGVGALRNVAVGRNAILIPGNHDAHDAVGRHYAIDAMDSLEHVFTGWSHLEPIIRNQIHFWGLGYKQDEEALELIHEIKARMDRRSTNILLLHQTLLGALAHTGEWKADEGIALADLLGFDLVLAGHYHLHQTLTEEDVNAIYLGAPVQHHFGDSGQKRGFHDLTMIVDKDGLTYSDKLVELKKVPRFHTFHWTKKGRFKTPPVPGEATEYRFRDGDYARFMVTGDGDVINAAKAEFDRMKGIVEAKYDLRGIRFQPVLIPTARKRVSRKVDLDHIDWTRIVADYVKATSTEDYDCRLLSEIGNACLGVNGGV